MKNNSLHSSQFTKGIYFSKIFIWIVIGVGLILRFRNYFSNRSLWADEAALALNIIEKPIPELLFRPLQYNQASPPGFLFAEKGLVNLLGTGELILRLTPFVAGVLSLFLFYKIAKKWISFGAVPLALLFFAVSGRLIYYSAELRPYSADVLIAQLLFLMIFTMEMSGASFWRWILFSIGGVIAFWFSYPAVFTLASGGSCLLVDALRKKQPGRFLNLAGICLAWLTSFVIYYFYVLSGATDTGTFQSVWVNYFPPGQLNPLLYLEWIRKIIFKTLDFFYGQSAFAAIPFLAVGGYSIYRRSKKNFLMMIAPLCFTLAASAFHQYPISGRLLLFFAPVLICFTAEGVASAFLEMKGRAGRVGVLLLAGLLLVGPFRNAASILKAPSGREEIKPVMAYIQKNISNQDKIFVYPGARYAFQYYLTQLDFGSAEYSYGTNSRENWKKYVEELNGLRGHKRVWVLFSHVCTWRGVDEEKFFIFHLNSIGKQLDYFAAPGASVYLYDLDGSAARN